MRVLIKSVYKQMNRMYKIHLQCEKVPSSLLGVCYNKMAE